MISVVKGAKAAVSGSLRRMNGKAGSQMTRGFFGVEETVLAGP